MIPIIYERQDNLSLTVPSSVAIVGVGGVGFYAAYFAAMSGVPRLVLFDSDRLEITNCNRLPYTPSQVGQLKTELAAQFIHTIRPECLVEQMGNATDISLLMARTEWVIDCTDNLATQLSLWKVCTPAGSPIYIRAGYDGTGFTVADSVPEWTTEETPTIGYTHDPSCACLSALPALLAVFKMLDRTKHAYAPIISMDISEIGKEKVAYVKPKKISRK